MKNVQISEDLLFALIKYHLMDMQELQPQIQKALEQKMDSMVKRQIYTIYKTAPTEEEREKARQEYLDKIGMNQDFRW
ncbi:MAG: complexin-2 [Clostridiales bacterium]|nr:complexin-2 [Clostridiales bacterium]